MRLETMIGGVAVGVAGILILLLVLLCLFAVALTAWGMYELSTNPDAKITNEDYAKLNRIINENQTRIINGGYPVVEGK